MKHRHAPIFDVKRLEGRFRQYHHDAVTSIMKHNSLVFVIGKMLPSKSPITKCENTDYEL